MWPMGLLFLKTSPVKQYAYENDISGVSDALHQSFLVYLLRRDILRVMGLSHFNSCFNDTSRIISLCY